MFTKVLLVLDRVHYVLCPPTIHVLLVREGATMFILTGMEFIYAGSVITGIATGSTSMGLMTGGPTRNQNVKSSPAAS